MSILESKTETHAIILNNKCRDNICSPLPALWQTLTLTLMEKNLRAEQSLPIDTMLKTHIQAISIL